MNVAVLIGIVGALAWIPGIWGVIEAIRKRRAAAEHAADEGDRIVVQSAVELLEPYRKEVGELKTKLAEATATIGNLNTELATARREAHELNEKLQNAQAELGYLRVQVSALSKQIPGNTP